MTREFTSERVGDALVFHAGPGEWFDQPHNETWDLEGEPQELPPSQRQIALDQTIESQAAGVSRVVVDVTEMGWLAGQDWGYLVRLTESLAIENVRLCLCAPDKLVKAGRLINLHEKMDVLGSLEKALNSR